MPEVYNWQLGRKMLYPYEERHPKWQFTFVFNINRCIACQTCSMADKSTWLFSKGQEYMWWNNVETKPYGGYPQFYLARLRLAGRDALRGRPLTVPQFQQADLAHLEGRSHPLEQIRQRLGLGEGGTG